jgi:predicted phage-related endonuclease
MEKENKVIEGNKELQSKLKKLCELKNQNEVLEEEIKKLQSEICEEMDAREAEVITDKDGKKLCTWVTTFSKRLDTTALKQSLPDVYTTSLKESAYKVFRATRA